MSCTLWIRSYSSPDIREHPGNIVDPIRAHCDGQNRRFKGCIKDENRS
jgi:hypothetical protein